MIRTTVRTFVAIAGLGWTLTVAPLMAQSTAPATAAPATASAATAKPSASKANAPVAFVAPPEKGMVWVNTASGVYHTEGMKYYGRTKQGKYMTEADAQKAGYHAAKKSGKS